MKSLPYYFLWNVTSTCIELMNRHWMILATWSKMWIFMKKSTSNAQFQNIFSFSGLFYSWLLEIQTLSFPSPGDLPPTRDWNRVSCTVGRCFTFWATRKIRFTLFSREKIQKDKKIIIQKDTCIPMFTAPLFTIDKTWK